MAYNSVATSNNLVATPVGGPEVQTESQIKLQNFWELEKADVEDMKPKQDVFKQQDLPLARIKKIMKLDEDLKNMMISAEAPVLFAKAAELFIREITLRAWIHTERNKRRTLQRNDIAMAVADPDTDMFDFLIDIVPREEVKPSQGRREDVVTPGGVAAPTGTTPSTVSQVQQLQQPVQYVFQIPGQIPGQQCQQSIQILMPQQFQQQGNTAAALTNGTSGSDVAQVVNAASGMQVVQLMPQQGNSGVAVMDGSQGTIAAVRQPIAGAQPIVVNTMTPQAIQIQNLGGQTPSVILQQPSTTSVVAGGGSGAGGAAASATGTPTASDAGQGDVSNIAAVTGTATPTEVVVKTDPLEDDSSSPTQDG